MDIVWANNAKLVKLNAENMFNMIEKILGFNVLLEKCLSKTLSGMPFLNPGRKETVLNFCNFHVISLSKNTTFGKVK